MSHCLLLILSNISCPFEVSCLDQIKYIYITHICSRFNRSPVLIISTIHQQKRTLYSPNLCAFKNFLELALQIIVIIIIICRQTVYMNKEMSKSYSRLLWEPGLRESAGWGLSVLPGSPHSYVPYPYACNKHHLLLKHPILFPKL